MTSVIPPQFEQTTYQQEFARMQQHLTRANCILARVCSNGATNLNLCKKVKIYIANSRVGDDSGIGAKMCKGKTVVYYLL